MGHILNQSINLICLFRQTQGRTHHAGEEHQEVESPHHLCKTPDAKIASFVVVREVAKAGHPHVGGNEDTDRVVRFTRLVVMVQQEKHLLGSGKMTVFESVEFRMFF